MKMTLAVFAVLMAASAWAQEQQAPPPSKADASASTTPAVKVFSVKPANVERIQRTLKMVVGEGNVVFDSASATLVVRTNPAMMPAVEHVVKELDAAAASAKNVELTFYILEATKEPAADSAPLPAELQPAVNQLKSVFAYRGFRLLDTAFIRARSGDWAEVSGLLEETAGAPQSYHLKLRPSVSSETLPATIRMDSLKFEHGVHWTTGSTINSGVIAIDSSADVKEGQQAIVGRAGIGGGHSALVLVASGRIVE